MKLADGHLLIHTWPAKYALGAFLSAVGVLLLWATWDQPWPARVAVGIPALILIAAALGAWISSRLAVDLQRVVTVQQRMVGIPFATVVFTPGTNPVRRVELDAHFSAMRAGGRDKTGTRSVDLRIGLWVRDDARRTLVKADSVPLPSSWSPPDDAAEALGWIERRGKGKIVESARRLAELTGCPLIGTGDGWGKDQGKALPMTTSGQRPC
jgi:hypothetical protein